MSHDEPKRPRDLLDVLVDGVSAPRPGEDDDAYVAPPRDTTWRARRTGLADVLAVLGVVFGYVLLIVPGILAARDRRAWRAGLHHRPRVAWALGGAALWAAVLVPLMLSPFRGLALLMGILTLPIVVRVAARG